MTDLDSIPRDGSQQGRYLFLREIAPGPFGSLYELRGTQEDKSLGGLGRVIQLPADVTAETEQSIAQAAWDSMELRHDLALCVADVMFGNGWFTLVHDFSEGSLVRSLQRRTLERQSAFPLAVALRVAFDVLDGLERNRNKCSDTGISWNPGGTSATSLYLCGDGRTRLLDGQLMTVLLRAVGARNDPPSVSWSAPELADAASPLDERSDVFVVGTLLWELLTGKELAAGNGGATRAQAELKAPSLTASVPKGYSISPALAKVVHAALEPNPHQRPATYAEFRAMLEATGTAAPYDKVIEFTDSLLNRESTLFRLNMETGPKLSDARRAERPGAPQVKWARELAQRAPPDEPSNPNKRTQLGTGRWVPPAHSKLLVSKTSPAKASTTVPRPTDNNPAKQLHNRTLIGLSADLLKKAPGPTIQPARTAEPIQASPVPVVSAVAIAANAVRSPPNEIAPNATSIAATDLEELSVDSCEPVSVADLLPQSAPAAEAVVARPTRTLPAPAQELGEPSRALITGLINTSLPTEAHSSLATEAHTSLPIEAKSPQPARFEASPPKIMPPQPMRVVQIRLPVLVLGIVATVTLSVLCTVAMIFSFKTKFVEPNRTVVNVEPARGTANPPAPTGATLPRAEQKAAPGGVAEPPAVAADAAAPVATATSDTPVTTASAANANAASAPAGSAPVAPPKAVPARHRPKYVPHGI